SSFDFSIDIIDLYTLQRTYTIHRTAQMKTAVALMTQGFLSNVPLLPSVTLSLETLELYRRLWLRKPSFSVEAFAKVVCDLYMIPYRRRYSRIIGDAFEIYLRVMHIVTMRVRAALGQDSPNWRVLNACPPCTYELTGEPELKYHRMFCMDGNDSLKRVRTLGKHQTADLRVFSESDYYIPTEEVDKYASEVRARDVPIGGIDDTPANDIENSTGDPTDGAENTVIDGCVHNWKAAQTDSKKKSWEMFEENGIFASACCHGLLLWIVDMVRSGELAKYPLAIIKQALTILGVKLLAGYDIGCAFEKTIRTSSLGPLFSASNSRCVVNAYHGYSHNYACQCKNHPSVIEGMGLEDLETMERIFSASNEVAGVTRYATAFRRRLFIDMHFQQWDEEKYRNLATMILNNYQQALKIINEDQAILEETLNTRNISAEDLDRWQAEQTAYFDTLGEEPAEDVHRITYVDLSLLDASSNRFLSAASTDYHFDIQTPTSVAAPSLESYRADQSRTQKLETQRRYASEKVDQLLREVNAMEVKLNIATRWGITSPEYLSTLKYVQERKYQRALDRLQRLVIQHLFKLHKLNLSGIAYKACNHLSKSLRTRSRAIRNATAAYNKAARELDPPRPELDWSKLSRYNYIEEFNLLKDCRTDIRTTPWAEPVIREAMKQRLRVKRANEEVIRCNIELRRLYTYIHGEKQAFEAVLQKLSNASDPIFFCVQEHSIRRLRINDHLLEQIYQCFNLPGFSGDRTLGHRVGSTPHMDTAINPDSTTVPLAREGAESDEDADESDGENAQVGGLIDYIASL
ncbi:hypothetical protein BYT27DRAFT_7071949, partial [Phlegmacium glaucopus]